MYDSTILLNIKPQSTLPSPPPHRLQWISSFGSARPMPVHTQRKRQLSSASTPSASVAIRWPEPAPDDLIVCQHSAIRSGARRCPALAAIICSSSVSGHSLPSASGHLHQSTLGQWPLLLVISNCRWLVPAAKIKNACDASLHRAVFDALLH